VGFGIGFGDEEENEVTEALSKPGDETTLLSLSGGVLSGMAHKVFFIADVSRHDIVDEPREADGRDGL